MMMQCLNSPVFMLELYTWKPLADLPNKKGFRFVGRTHDGLEIVCKVWKRNETHYVLGCPSWTRLKAWRDLTASDEEALTSSLD